MRISILFIVLSVSLSAAVINNSEMKELRHSYGLLKHAFELYQYHERVMEIKFVREDKTVCGVHWDLFKLKEEDHSIWHAVSHGITDTMFYFDMKFPKRINDKDITKGLHILRKSLMTEDRTARHIYNFGSGGLDLLTAQNIDEIIDAPSVTPWTIMFTRRALHDNTPGTLFITALGADLCLMRKPVPTASTPITRQEQQVFSERLNTMETKQNWLSTNTVQLPAWGQVIHILERMEKRLDCVEKRLDCVGKKVEDLNQRVGVLEIKDNGDI